MVEWKVRISYLRLMSALPYFSKMYTDISAFDFAVDIKTRWPCSKLACKCEGNSDKFG